jgi:DNA-binding GntR family transcriptional regulator
MRTIEKSESLKQQIYNLLKEEILNQRYNDEDILNERKISEELKVSRTPVREALKALEAENWVEYVPYKGIIIKKMGEKDLKNIFQIRTSLELLTVELAMENMTRELVGRLEESHQKQNHILTHCNNPKKGHFLDLDVEFHGILLEMADNALLTVMIGEIRDKIRRFGMNAIFSGDYRYTETLEEHLGILVAIQANDIELAKEKMKYHMLKTYESAYAYVTSSRKS